MKSISDRFDALVAALTIPPALTGEVASLGAEIKRAADRLEAFDLFSPGITTPDRRLETAGDDDYEIRRVPGCPVRVAWKVSEPQSAALALNLATDFPRLPEPMEAHFRELKVMPVIVLLDGGLHRSLAQASDVTVCLNSSHWEFMTRAARHYFVLHELIHVFVNTGPAFRVRDQTATTEIVERTLADGRVEVFESEVLVDHLLIEWGRRWLVEDGHLRTVWHAINELSLKLRYLEATGNAGQIEEIHKEVLRIFDAVAPCKPLRRRTPRTTLATLATVGSSNG